MFHCCLQPLPLRDILQRIFSESDLCLNDLIPFNRSPNWPPKRSRFCSAQRTTEQCRAGLTKDGRRRSELQRAGGASIMTQQRRVCLAPRHHGRRALWTVDGRHYHNAVLSAPIQAQSGPPRADDGRRRLADGHKDRNMICGGGSRLVGMGGSRLPCPPCCSV